MVNEHYAYLEKTYGAKGAKDYVADVIKSAQDGRKTVDAVASYLVKIGQANRISELATKSADKSKITNTGTSEGKKVSWVGPAIDPGYKVLFPSIPSDSPSPSSPGAVVPPWSSPAMNPGDAFGVVGDKVVDQLEKLVDKFKSYGMWGLGLVVILLLLLAIIRR